MIQASNKKIKKPSITNFKNFSIPYIIWLAIFVVIPLFLLIIVAFSSMEKSISFVNYRPSLYHISEAFSNANSDAFLNSLVYSFITTVGCILIGYPVAYIVSMSKLKNKYLMILLIIFPMWICMVLRLKILNYMFSGMFESVLGIPLNISGTTGAVILVMVIMYLPFMILPIFTQLEKIDRSLFEASADLGATPVKTFTKVTLPLSLKGVISGIIMVFLPCATGFAIPQIIGNGNVELIGNYIERYFVSGGASEYNVGSVVSLVIIIAVIGSLFFIFKTDPEGDTLI